MIVIALARGSPCTIHLTQLGNQLHNTKTRRFYVFPSYYNLYKMAEPQSPLNYPPGPIPHPLIRKPKASTLSRDQRRDYQLLHGIRWSYSQIRRHTGHTIRQIGVACGPNGKATPKKSTSRPPSSYVSLNRRASRIRLYIIKEPANILLKTYRSNELQG